MEGGGANHTIYSVSFIVCCHTALTHGAAKISTAHGTSHHPPLLNQASHLLSLHFVSTSLLPPDIFPLTLVPLSNLHPGVDVVGVEILVVRELPGEGLQLCNSVILGINVTLERLVDLVQCLQ